MQPNHFLSRDYSGINITAPTVSGYGRISKLYGKTIEEGTGEKSPSNSYVIKSVGDNMNLFDWKSVVFEYKSTGTFENGILKMKPTVNGGPSYCRSNDFTLSPGNYILSYDANSMLESMNLWHSGTTNLFSSSDIFTVTEKVTLQLGIYVKRSSINNELILSNLKVEEGSTSTTYSNYGKGTIEIESSNTDGTQTNKLIIETEPLNKIIDNEGNVVTQDFIDFDNLEIVYRCKQVNISGTSNTLSDASIDSRYICNQCPNSYLNGKLLESVSLNNAVVIYQLATEMREKIKTDKIVQYEEQTTIKCTDELQPQIEIELTKNKAISKLNSVDKRNEKNIENIENAIKTNDITNMFTINSANAEISKTYTSKIYKTSNMVNVILYLTLKSPSSGIINSVELGNLNSSISPKNTIHLACMVGGEENSGWTLNHSGEVIINSEGFVRFKSINSTTTQKKYIGINIFYLI